VGLKFQIHNGKKYDDITITEDMVGHKLGEFAPYVPYSFEAHVTKLQPKESQADSSCRTRKNFTYKQTKNK
jgi:ribosomal protein S19